MFYANNLVDSFQFSAGWLCLALEEIEGGEAHLYRFTNHKVVVVVEVDLLIPNDPSAAKVTKVINYNEEEEESTSDCDDNYYSF